MLFSEHFGIKRDSNAEWFDPVLDHDTKVFIDPFLLFRLGEDGFAEAHSKLVSFFDDVFLKAASAAPHPSSLGYKKILNTLIFPEVSELCLGYAGAGISGAGTAKGFAKDMARAVFRSIQLGITHVNHFEEIGLFNTGISCDRISDITANILKPDFVSYTQDICEQHDVPMEAVQLSHNGFDSGLLVWRDDVVDLPVNPHTGRGILLVPTKFLRRLPTVSVEGFWDYIWETHADALRDDLNFTIKSGVNKKEIIKIAQVQRDWVHEYVAWVDLAEAAEPYNLQTDPAGLYLWALASSQFTTANPLSIKPAKTGDEFVVVIEKLLAQFKHFVEQNNGYKLLWNDNPLRPKSEEAAQLLFFGIAKHYCVANNIDISKEVNLGRGAVDFKFSTGYESRVHIEVKLAKNSKFWAGLKKQLPTYMKAEEVKRGYFLVIFYTTEEMERKLVTIHQVVKEVTASESLILGTEVVDATQNKPSASKLRP
jgi:hypothetical protein